MIRTLRSLGRDPVLMAAAGVTLAVSIAANTTLFSAANSILVRPLPYPDAERIEWIGERSGRAQQEIGTAPDYYRIREWNRSFEEVAAFAPSTTTWTGVEHPEQLDTTAVSASFFRVMGSPPALGRYFGYDEEGSRAPKIVVLSYAFWQSRMGGDPNVVGRSIGLDRVTRTIVGVMPQGFAYPRGSQVWIPLGLDEASEKWLSPSRPIFVVSIVARRKRDVSRQAMQADLDRMAVMLRREYHIFPSKFRWDVVVSASALQQHLTGPVRPALVALSGAAGLVLLMACVNLANLLLARGGARRRELAVRLALGASRGRILRQVLAESLWMAVPGGVAGIGLAAIAVGWLNRWGPQVLLRYPAVTIDWHVLAFTGGITIAAALLFGLAPGLAAARIQVQEALKSGGMTHSGGAGGWRLRKLLLVSELGVSLVLLIGAGLLARTFLNLSRTELGFRADHLLTFRLNPIGPMDRDYTNFYRDVLERLRGSAMTQSAALMTDIPLDADDFSSSGRIRVVGREMVPFQQRPVIDNTVVSPEFFETLGIAPRKGRIFDWHDTERGATMTNYGMASEARVVVNEAFVRRLFPGEDPVGRAIVFGPDQNSVTWRIVGVVGDVRGGSLSKDAPAMVYRCVCEGSRIFRAAFAVRTEGDPRAAIGAVEAVVHRVDRDEPIFDVKTMEERREMALTAERFELGVIGAFALIAMVLAAAGVYGVTSYLVARRTREIGIRVAVGARPRDVLEMVLGDAMVLAVTGCGAGLGGAWVLTRSLRAMLYGVTELDTATFALAAAMLTGIVLAACLAPARRASRIDPVIALREE